MSEYVVEDTTGLREFKKARTRAAIEEAAMRLFGDKGFDETTIADIAQAVVISPRTFFRYFASKEDVLLAREREELLALGKRLAERPKDEPLRDSLLAVFLPLTITYEEACAKTLPRFKVIVANPSLLGMYLLMMGSFEQVLCDALAARLSLDAESQRPRLLAAVIVSAFRIAAEKWMELEGSVPLPDLLRESFTILDAGLLK